MCGIIGGITNTNFNSEVLLKTIEHRGPDNSMLINLGNVFLGHTRLSIQDLSAAGNQPMYSECKNYVIVFNGEIYNFKTLFPEYPVPNIITMFSGFNYGVIVEDSLIAIGLDFYLGKNSVFYQRLGDPEYLRSQKQAKFIIPNVMEAWYDSFFSFTNKRTNFLSELIYKGKIMYLISNTLENFPLADQLRFNNNDLEWCDKNESSIWAFLIDNDLLFSSREKEYRSYINHAPFSKGMTQESPSRIAYYIGYEIVEKYMKNNNEVSIKELMFEEDFMKILTKSKYKP